jgi:hypothetical protein
MLETMASPSIVAPALAPHRLAALSAARTTAVRATGIASYLACQNIPVQSAMSPADAEAYCVSERPEPAASRLMLVGSSTMGGAIGVPLSRALHALDIEVENLGQASTSLARGDIMHWPTRLREDMRRFEPDLILAQIGGNDCQPIIGPDDRVRARRHELDAWHQAYAIVLIDLVQAVRSYGARIALLDLQPARNEEYNACVRGINEVTRQVATTYGIPLLSVYALTQGNDGAYSERIAVDGDMRDIRSDDGYHLNIHGGRYIARQTLLFLINEGLIRTWD